MDILIYSLVVLLFVIAFLALPFRRCPDMPFLWSGFLLYALCVDSDALPWFFWLPVTMLTLVMVVVSRILDRWALIQERGSRRAPWVALVGLLFLTWPLVATLSLSLLVMPFLGLILLPLGLLVLLLGPFLPAAMVEWWVGKRSPEESVRIGIGTTLGFALPLAFKAFLMALMLLFFAILAGVGPKSLQDDYQFSLNIPQIE